jgi:hypothetical protein
VEFRVYAILAWECDVPGKNENPQEFSYLGTSKLIRVNQSIIYRIIISGYYGRVREPQLVHLKAYGCIL